MSKRTTIRFRTEGDIWPLVDKWAGGNGYRLKGPAGSTRTYQKGTGFLVAPMMLNIKNDGQETMFEAWIRGTFIARLMSLFILPAEMGIQSGGFRAVVPRGIARKAINKLVSQLGSDAAIQ